LIGIDTIGQRRGDRMIQIAFMDKEYLEGARQNRERIGSTYPDMRQLTDESKRALRRRRRIRQKRTNPSHPEPNQTAPSQTKPI